MSRTKFLVAIAVAALLMQFLPSQANNIKWIAIALGIVYLVVRALRTYPRLFREKRARAAQAAADESQYQQYRMEMDAIRAKHDFSRDMSADGAVTEDSQAELTALHEKYHAMLERKFGRGDKSLEREPVKSYK